MALLIKHIRGLVHTEDRARLKYNGFEMSAMLTIEDAYLFIAGSVIHSFGKSTEENLNHIRTNHPGLIEIDATGCMVFPCWCDAHTHIVYAGSRELEFVDRINGLSYADIAKRGGGILNSAHKLRNTDSEQLYQDALSRLDEMMLHGTGAVEIKSGYGLDVESELKMLRVIRRLKENSEITIKATFLGAHAVPGEYSGDKKSYLDLVINEMLPAVEAEGLAEYCDVFCEQNYFSKEDALRLFDAACRHGLIPKVHAEQLSHTGGIEAGVEMEAISVDHLEYADENDIKLLSQSSTMPVLLPGAQFFLGMQNPPARQMIAAGLPVALSTDFNPGSCPSGNMNQMVSFACIMYRMKPEEAIIAATTNSAYAMGVSHKLGSIATGKTANVFITKPASSYAYLPYSFGFNPVETVILNGKVMNQTSLTDTNQ